ncbi:MAG: hypothetical protein Q9228_003917 [Teloschistes exilis]
MVRMFLVGIFDEYPGLRVLLAHAGGAVGALGDRVQSCVEHERGYYSRTNAERIKGPKRSLKEVLKKNVWFDAISYGATGLRMAVELVGKERVMWGSDHPFFPPVGGSEDEEEEEWASVRTNVAAVQEAFGKDEQGMRGSEIVKVMGYNFNFYDWFELLSLRHHIIARKEEYAEVRCVWDFQDRLSQISTDLGMFWNSGFQTAKDAGSIQEIIKKLKETGTTLNEQSKAIETDLLRICEEQIGCILTQAEEEGDFNQEQSFMMKSCFFPGKEILFLHDPNEILINADLTIPVIRRPGYEESIPESADMPLDDSYYEDVSNEASDDEDEDDGDKSGSEIGKQRMTWWCSSALKQLNEDRHEMAEP